MKAAGDMQKKEDESECKSMDQPAIYWLPNPLAQGSRGCGWAGTARQPTNHLQEHRARMGVGHALPPSSGWSAPGAVTKVSL